MELLEPGSRIPIKQGEEVKKAKREIKVKFVMPKSDRFELIFLAPSLADGEKEEGPEAKSSHVS